MRCITDVYIVVVIEVTELRGKTAEKKKNEKN